MAQCPINRTEKGKESLGEEESGENVACLRKIRIGIRAYTVLNITTDTMTCLSIGFARKERIYYESIGVTSRYRIMPAISPKEFGFSIIFLMKKA